MKARTIEEWTAVRPSVGAVRSIADDKLYLGCRRSDDRYEWQTTATVPLEDIRASRFGWRAYVARRLMMVRRELREQMKGGGF